MGQFRFHSKNKNKILLPSLRVYDNGYRPLLKIRRQRMDRLQPGRPAIELVAMSDWFEDLSSIEAKKLAAYFNSHIAKPGDCILNEGSGNNFFCIICDGSVDVIKENDLAHKKLLLTLGPGKIFGELSFFDKGPCSASIVVKDEVSLLVMDDKNFKTLCQQSTTLALYLTLKILRITSQRVRQTSSKMVDQLT